MSKFRALLVSKSEQGQTVEWKKLDSDDLMPGDVTVSISHTTINYKDGLAVTGKGPGDPETANEVLT
jgi:acrylyl-CoA reductase (NADPH)